LQLKLKTLFLAELRRAFLADDVIGIKFSDIYLLGDGSRKYPKRQQNSFWCIIVLMIAKLQGSIIHKDEKSVVVDVGGVGYKVFTTPINLLALQDGDRVNFWTHLSVKETALEIYGFKEKEDLNIFELLISVTGIGPRSALGILNISSANSLKRGIMEGDVTYLTKVSGIGKKTAEKIVLELRDKLGAKGEYGGGTKEDVEVVEALQVLGYSREEARDALRKISADAHGTTGKIKESLKILGG